MAGDIRASKRQRCVGIMSTTEHGNYFLLWYIHTNMVFQLLKKKMLNRLTAGYLHSLLMGSMLQVHNCLKQSLPKEIRQFYSLLPFFPSLNRNLAFIFIPMGRKTAASNSDGTELIN